MDYRGRIEAVKEHLVEEAQDAFLLTGSANTFYFSGFHTMGEGDYPMLLIPKEGDTTLLVSPLDEHLAKDTAHTDTFVPEGKFTDGIIGLLPDEADVLITGSMSTKLYTTLSDTASLTVENELISELRSIKEQEEIDRINTAYAVAEKSLQETLEQLDALDTETAVAAEIEYHMRKHGSAGTAFPTIVGSGASSSFPHHSTSNTPVGEGTLLFDIGATVDGYCSDMSRTVSLGEPSDRFKTVYELVRTAQEAAASKLRPGVSAADIDAAAREVINEEEYKEEFPHSTGHGVGIDVHESPNLTHKSEKTLKENMVVTIEPGIYLQNQFGVRIEDAYVITKNGAERITQSSRELQVL